MDQPPPRDPFAPEDEPLPGSDEEGSGSPLDDLPIAGLTRRRVAFMLGALVSVWILAVFARQIGEATSAAARVDTVRQENVRLEAEVGALARERDLIQRQAFIELQARAYGLGSPQERRFVLAADAPPLPLDAPGSAALRIGAPDPRPSPLEVWLSVLFGPSPDG